MVFFLCVEMQIFRWFYYGLHKRNVWRCAVWHQQPLIIGFAFQKNLITFAMQWIWWSLWLNVYKFMIRSFLTWITNTESRRKTQTAFCFLFLYFFCLYFFSLFFSIHSYICFIQIPYCHCIQHSSAWSAIFRTPASKTKKNLKFFPHSCACELCIVSNDSTEN